MYLEKAREMNDEEIEVTTTTIGGGGGGDNGGGRDHNEAEKSSVVVLSGGRDEASMFLVWEDLNVVLPGFGNNGSACRRLLHGLSGYAEPGRIMAIMGPSGSGKSTLLDSLAGRLQGNVVMTGNVLLNGKKRRLEYGGVAYVTQEDIMLGTLTVKETLTYSANMRLPAYMSKEQINELVEGTLMEMGLQDCTDKLIGNWHLRGISGGEKKRLSIALEILTRPRLLFLDEPTSGLDSASAFFVVQTLRNIACDGRTVISSIHQPSSEVFALFDDLFLLSGGETVYFGEAKMAIKFFAESGFPCPSRRNPSDHFLRCINSDFDDVTATLMGSRKIHVCVWLAALLTFIYFGLGSLQDIQKSSNPLMNMATAEIKRMLVQKYKFSVYAARARTRIQEISAIQGLVIKTRGGSEARWWKQLTTLTRRSFVNMSRDVGYYWLRIVIYIALSICVGTVFFNVGTNYSAIIARGACGAFVSGFMTFMSIGGFPSFIEEMKVFYRERLNGHYGVGVFILSNFFSSFPFLVLMSSSSASITYYMVKFRPEFSHFVYTCLDLVSSIAVVESCMMIVASLVPNFLMGIVLGAGVIGIMMMTAGFFRLQSDLPKPFWRYPISYINYQAWALQGAYKNDMIGLEFDPLVAGGPRLKGEDILKDMLGVRLDHSKWWDLALVIVILISYRLLFFSILKFKERFLPQIRFFYSKRTIKHLNKRPSFSKQLAIHSKRQQNIPSLSSQEGLNSPIHYM